MPAPAVSVEEFAETWRRCGGSPAAVAAALGRDLRGVMARRERLAKQGIILETQPADGRVFGVRRWSRPSPHNPSRNEFDLKDGVAIVFSDAHYWPGEASVAHKALLTLIRRLRPRLIVANGDLLDGATISRHDRDGWAPRPSVKQEIDVTKERTGEIEDAAGVDTELIWNIGNHDMRFERYIAMNAPALEGIPGTTLPEHFPRWTFGMSLMVNPSLANPVMIKHRNAGGLHAAYNNTLRGGVSMVTGHLHRLVVTTWGDYRGRRYGVDTGTLAQVDGPHTAYHEDSPSPAGQGFVVLTFHEGELIYPELVEVRAGKAFFRGELV